MNVDTGQLIPARCRASFCEYCGPIQSMWKSRIISDGGTTGPPQRYVVLTNAPADFDVLRQKVRNFKRYIEKRDYSWAQSWTVEEGDQTGMRHVNVLQKGSYVPQALLQDVWGAIVHIQAIDGGTGANVAGYALKEARKVAGYATKDARGEKLARHLELNGGRLVHLSRDYLGGQTQAEVLKRLISETATEGTWVVVPRSNG